MATLLGTDLYAKQAATLGNPAAKPNQREAAGERVEYNATYTILGTEASGDTLPLVIIPIGATLRTLFVSTDAIGGTTCTIVSIGDAGSATRYSSTAIPLTAAQSETAMTKTNAECVTPFVVDTAANQTILCVTGGTWPATAGKKIVVRGEYLMP